MKKVKRITIRFQQDDITRIENEAAAAGETLAGYCRAKVLDGKEVKKLSKLDENKLKIYEKEIRGQIFGMSNNLNQLAKGVNTILKSGIIDPEQAIKILNDLQDWYLTHKNLKTEILKRLGDD